MPSTAFIKQIPQLKELVRGKIPELRTLGGTKYTVRIFNGVCCNGGRDPYLEIDLNSLLEVLKFEDLLPKTSE